MTGSRRRAGLYLSLLILVAATSILSLTDADAGPLVRFGRPAVVVLAAILLLRGRAWARWLLLVLALGALLDGPLGVVNGVAPWYMAGLLLWTISLVCLLALIAVFRAARALHPPDSTGLHES